MNYSREMMRLRCTGYPANRLAQRVRLMTALEAKPKNIKATRNERAIPV